MSHILIPSVKYFCPIYATLFMQVDPAEEHTLKEYQPVPEMGFGDKVAGQMAKSHKRLHPHKHTCRLKQYGWKRDFGVHA